MSTDTSEGAQRRTGSRPTNSVNDNKRWSQYQMPPIMQDSELFMPQDPAVPAAAARPRASSKPTPLPANPNFTVPVTGASGVSTLGRTVSADSQPRNPVFGVPITGPNPEPQKSMRKASTMSDTKRLSTMGEDIVASVVPHTGGYVPPRRQSRSQSVANQTKRLSKRFSTVTVEGEEIEEPPTRPTWTQQPEIDLTEPWEKDPTNPLNWRRQKKVANTGVAVIVAFVCLFTATISAAAESSLMTHLQISSFESVLPYPLFVIGLAFGPFLAGPTVESYGRRLLFVMAIPLFAIFTLIPAFHLSAIGLIICRLFAGLAAGPLLTTSLSIVSDIWWQTRSVGAVAIYAAFLVLGIPAGPLVGFCLIQKGSWHWIQWVPLALIAFSFLLACGMSESHHDTLLKRRAQQAALRQAEDPSWQNPEAERKSGATRSTFGKRAITTMFTQPLQTFLSLYLSVAFATTFAICIIMPRTIAAQYSFDLPQQGLAYLGMIAGVVVALVMSSLLGNLGRRSSASSPATNEVIEEKPLVQPRQAPPRNMSSSTANTNRRQSYQTRASIAALKRQSQYIGPDDEPVPEVPSQYDMADVAPVPRRQSYQTRASIAASTKRKSMIEVKEVEVPGGIPKKDMSIAIAVTDYINKHPSNRNKAIVPERVLVILGSTPGFSTICESLEKLGVSFDRVDLAKVIVDAAEENDVEGDDLPVARSMSLHREAAHAALVDHDSPRPSVPTIPEVNEQGTHEQRTHAHMRLVPALLASVILPAGIFLFGWTATSTVTYIAPLVGTGIMAMGTMLLYVSSTIYTLDRCDAQTAESVLAGRTVLTFLISGGFSLLATPLYAALDTAIASTVFGGVAVALGIAPWVAFFMSRPRASLHKEAP